ncbi:MAG: signal peptide peptidase SppA [Verrucomicrobia bacterium]|nr:signal peptide peptidase SppA [Verrucomicrobiota bacterium]
MLSFRMNRPPRLLLLIGLILLGTSLIANLLFLSKDHHLFSAAPHVSPPPSFEEELVEGDDSQKKRIAKIDLFGVIAQEIPGEIGSSMVDDVILQIRQAAEDDSVAALLLHIDSPGGEVTASDNLYHELTLIREDKPVIVYMDSVAASGGYYTAMGGSHLVAHELCITGSIGVIMQTINYEGLSKILGLSTLTFKSGALKDLLNPSRTPTDPEKKLVQDMIQETFARFSSVVTTERQFAGGKLPSDLADGRIVSGKQALDMKLVDATGYLEDAIADARQIAKLPEDAPVIRYVVPFHISKLLRFLGQKSESKIQLNLGPESFHLQTGKLYYLSTHLFRH